MAARDNSVCGSQPPVGAVPGSHGQLSRTSGADFGKVKAVLILTPHKLLTLPQCFALYLLTCIVVSSWVYKEKILKKFLCPFSEHYTAPSSLSFSHMLAQDFFLPEIPSVSSAQREYIFLCMCHCHSAGHVTGQRCSHPPQKN